MKARIADYLFITPQRQRLTIDVYDDMRALYDKVKDLDVEIKITRRTQKRSLDANAYMWVLLDKLATETGIPVKELYFDQLRNVGGNMEVYCGVPKAIDALCADWETRGTFGYPYDRFPSKLDGCENVRLYYGSSTFDSATMGRMIDNIVALCKDFDIEVLPDDELKSLYGGEDGQKRI